MKIEWQTISCDFEPDGSLRDIYVFSTTANDWERLHGYLRQQGADLRYSLDGEPAPLPASVAEVFAARVHSTPLLTFKFGPIRFAMHFFSADELEFDFWPEDLHGQDDLDILLDFVQRVGELLGKPVFITPENGAANAFLEYRPDSHEFRYTRPAGDRNL